jgi:acyl-CoA synthetase (AMP-forming)/AMP-acid ligase II
MSSVIDLIDYGLKLQPSNVCLVDRFQTYTHSEVQLASHRIANAIHSEGLAGGARIGFFTLNCSQAMVAMIGTFRAGAVWLPVHPKNIRKENLEFLVENKCELLFFHSQMAEDAIYFKSMSPFIKVIICLDSSYNEIPSVMEWSANQDSLFDVKNIGPDEIVWVKGTGGTTGRSKSVLVTNRCACALFTTFNWCLPLPSGHVTLVAAPVSHGAGTYALCGLCNGGSIVFIEKPEPAAVIKALIEYKITTVFLPPTVIYKILAMPNLEVLKYESLRYLIYSAAPMSPERLADAIKVFGPVLTQIYGQTEAPAMLTVLRPEEHIVSDREILKKRLSSCGRPTPFVKLEIMDDDGHILGVNKPGEIVVRGELVMKGYRDDPEETAKVSKFGWHHTGDIGYKDDDGYFYIVDRKKDMIISGGFNIFPSEIEQVLLKHKAVLDCAVIGAPDAQWGEVVTAIVELKPGFLAEISELQMFCRESLGGMKTPKHVEIWPQLPRSSVGKVLRKDIREHLWKDQVRRI